MGVQNTAADLPAMKSDPKVRLRPPLPSSPRNPLLTVPKFIFFTDFDGTITLQDSESAALSKPTPPTPPTSPRPGPR